MRNYVKATWGDWIEEEQIQKHRENFNLETHQSCFKFRTSQDSPP